MKHIIFYSGGIGSYFTAKRIVEKYGANDVILLFTDTKIEDEDCYRFIKETSNYLGAELVKIEDGRTPFEVYKDVKFLGNSRLAPCSHKLKQETASKWIKENFKPDECVLYLGIDWTESHRKNAPIKNWHPYKVEFPMCEPPYLTKTDMIEALKDDGIKTPRLYEFGFSHNNCGGFCCRAGQGHFANLLKQLPERYKHYEEEEEKMRKYLGKDVAMMSKTKNKVKTPYTLKQLRQDVENHCQIDLFDIGGCGCFIDD